MRRAEVSAGCLRQLLCILVSEGPLFELILMKLGRQRPEDPWGSLASQPSQSASSRFMEKLCLRNQDAEQLTKPALTSALLTPVLRT